MNTFGYNGGAFNGPPLDASVRSAINGQAYAISSITARAGFRSVIESYPQATAALVVTVFSPVRAVLDAVAEAVATIVGRVAMRGAIAATAVAQTTHEGRSATRYEVRAPVTNFPQAVGVIVPRMAARSPLVGGAAVTTTLNTRAGMRSPLNGAAQAMGYVSGGVAHFVPFDALASSENTFTVPFIDNVFYVR